MPAGGEQVEALAKKVEDMKTQMKAIGGTVRSVSTPRSRSPRRSTAPFRTMDEEFMPFRAPSLDTFAGMATKRAAFRDARAASARAALRGRRLT